MMNNTSNKTRFYKINMKECQEYMECPSVYNTNLWDKHSSLYSLHDLLAGGPSFESDVECLTFFYQILYNTLK